LASPIEATPAPAPAPTEVEAAPAETSAASSSTAMGRRGDSDAPSKKRGWTMFMEKPIDKGADPLGGVAPSSGESNSKGWTVFSPAADGSAQSAADSAQLAMMEEAASAAASASFEREHASAPDAGPLAAAGQTNFEDDDAAARAQALADERARIRTVVVTGPPDPSLANNRLKTMVAEHSPVAPARITVVNPEAPIHNDALSGPPGSISTGVPGAISGPISTGMTGPISTGISGPISTGMTGPSSTSMPVHRGSHAMEPAKKGSPVVLIVVGVLLVAAAIGAAFVFLN
jgi:hypothetical protein